MVPHVASYKPKHLRGFAVVPVSCQALLHCISASDQASAEELDKDYFKLASYHLTSGSGYHLVSNAAQSLVVGVDASVLSQKLTRLASGHWMFNRFQRRLLENQVSSSTLVALPLAYCEALAWDETPLKAAMPGGSGLSGRSDDALCQVAEDGELKAIGRLSSSLRPDSLICKILQCQQWCGLLVKIGNTFVKILYQQICPLQVLQKTNAEIVQEALFNNQAAPAATQGSSFVGALPRLTKRRTTPRPSPPSACAVSAQLSAVAL